MKLGLWLAGAIILAATVYLSPNIWIAQARKRGEYIPPQDFEWGVRKWKP